MMPRCERPAPTNCVKNNSGVRITKTKNDYHVSLCFNGSCVPDHNKDSKWIKCCRICDVCRSLLGTYGKTHWTANINDQYQGLADPGFGRGLLCAPLKALNFSELIAIVCPSNMYLKILTIYIMDIGISISSISLIIILNFSQAPV